MPQFIEVNNNWTLYNFCVSSVLRSQSIELSVLSAAIGINDTWIPISLLNFVFIFTSSASGSSLLVRILELVDTDIVEPPLNFVELPPVLTSECTRS